MAAWPNPAACRTACSDVAARDVRAPMFACQRNYFAFENALKSGSKARLMFVVDAWFEAVEAGDASEDAWNIFEVDDWLGSFESRCIHHAALFQALAQQKSPRRKPELTLEASPLVEFLGSRNEVGLCGECACLAVSVSSSVCVRVCLCLSRRARGCGWVCVCVYMFD